METGKSGNSQRSTDDEIVVLAEDVAIRGKDFSPAGRGSVVESGDFRKGVTATHDMQPGLAGGGVWRAAGRAGDKRRIYSRAGFAGSGTGGTRRVDRGGGFRVNGLGTGGAGGSGALGIARIGR